MSVDRPDDPSSPLESDTDWDQFDAKLVAQITREERRSSASTDRPVTSRVDKPDSPAASRPENNDHIPDGTSDADWYPFIPFHTNIRSGEPRYLVRGLVPRTGLTVVYGSPGSGKTNWAVDISIHVALGWPYRGREVLQGAVIYCAVEDPEGVADRRDAFRKQFLQGHKGTPQFLIYDLPLDLCAEHQQLIDLINRTPAKAPRLVVIDTMNRAFSGRENEDHDMRRFIRAAESISRELNCAVLLVHHCGHEGGHPRGHSSLMAAADALIRIRTRAGHVVADVEKMKNGPSGDTLASSMEVVTLAPYPDGYSETSVVLVEAASVPREAKPLSPRHEDALMVLKEFIGANGATASESLGLPEGTLVVPVEDWRDALFEKNVIPQDGNPRQTFKRIRERLKDEELIGFEDDLVWIVP